jgi:WD40 repeat protein
MTFVPDKTHVVKTFTHKSPLIACRFDARGRFVFASAEDGSIRRFELATGKDVPLIGHESWVFALASSPDGETFVSGGGDGRLIWWSTSAPKPAPVRTIQAHRGWIRSIAISPDGKLLASCGNDRMVRVWSLATGERLLELPGHERPVYRVLFTAGGSTLLSADLRGIVIEWDHRPGKEARRLDAGKLSIVNGAGQGVDYGGVRDLALSPDGRFLACGGLIEASNPLGAVSNPAVLVFDWKTGKESKLLRPKENVLGLVWGLRFHPSGIIVAASGGNAGGHVWFWKPEQQGEIFKLTLPNTARDMDLHPDGMQIATAHHDGNVRVSIMGPNP